MLSGVSSISPSGASSPTRGARSVFPVQPVQKVSPRPGAVEMPEPDRAEGTEALVFDISDEARAQAKRAADLNVSRGETGENSSPPPPEQTGSSTEVVDSRSQPSTPSNPNELSESEEQQVRELRARDAEVRTHEQAHKSVGGQYAGAIHYDFQRGPDGQNYAIGGHVNIDVSEIPNDPAATVAKMQQIVRAALAPAEPSGADRRVAATANGKAADARAQLAEQRAQGVRKVSQAEVADDPAAEDGTSIGAAFAREESGFGLDSERESENEVGGMPGATSRGGGSASDGGRFRRVA